MEQLSSRLLCPDLTEKSYGSRGGKIESLNEVIFLWDGDKLPCFWDPTEYIAGYGESVTNTRGFPDQGCGDRAPYPTNHRSPD